jgi:FAD dependent oxidoreductase
MGETMERGRVIELPQRTAEVIAKTDVVVVGGGPAGVSAAVAAARAGADVVLVERYPYLGGLASGGLVLVLDDLNDGDEVSVRGLCQEYIDRMEAVGLTVTTPPGERGLDPEVLRRWTRWGLYDFKHVGLPKPIMYQAAFDPDGWKRVSNDLVREAGVTLLLHSWFSEALVEDGRARGVVSQTKQGPQAVLADVVIDGTGDADVAASAGVPFEHGSFKVTTVFRLGGVDTDRAEQFEEDEPKEAARINREAKRVLGGAWTWWWLKTPLPGVVWCNCPHMSGYDALSPADLTEAELRGHDSIVALLGYARANMPGFEDCYVVDVAPQVGVRQTRLVHGEYVLTKDDVTNRRHFADSVARGRDFYIPYRSLLPRGVDQLLVPGRHLSADSGAQLHVREIPTCMTMGQAAGVAAAVALDQGRLVRDVDVARVQKRLWDQGADPGDTPSPRATVDETAP